MKDLDKHIEEAEKKLIEWGVSSRVAKLTISRVLSHKEVFYFCKTDELCRIDKDFNITVKKVKEAKLSGRILSKFAWFDEFTSYDKEEYAKTLKRLEKFEIKRV